jgi:CRISPR-associated exonuclease Cas4
VSLTENRQPQNLRPQEPEKIPLSLLNDFLYCPRRAALKLIEGWRQENVHTARGDIVHEHTDLRGYETVEGVKLLRSLPVFSECLGLNGKCDVVEQRPDGSFYPVEFKVGKRRRWENDDAQVCAQAMCLEEMLGVSVLLGAVFHADSKRRREVSFTADLRALVEHASAGLHGLADAGRVPAAEYRDSCIECSLYDVCLPEITSGPDRILRSKRELFEV